MEFENLEAIIDFAIDREREAAEFYQTISDDEEDFSGSKQMFAEFAAEEKKHEKILLEFKSEGISKSLQEYQLKWITDIKRSNYLVDLSYEKGMPYNEILLLAMKREENALKLYNDFLEQADTEESKKLFKVLCQEEAKHKLALETMYDDYMAKMPAVVSNNCRRFHFLKTALTILLKRMTESWLTHDLTVSDSRCNRREDHPISSPEPYRSNIF